MFTLYTAHVDIQHMWAAHVGLQIRQYYSIIVLIAPQHARGAELRCCAKDAFRMNILGEQRNPASGRSMRSTGRGMPKDTRIFGLRFESNADLNPSQDDLGHFLESTNKAGSREPHSSDLARYHGLIESIREFTGRQSAEEAHDIRDRMFYGVLGFSQFVHPDLELAVGQFKYHLHNLASLDFRKPEAFIKTAEEEMAGLDPKRKADAAKLERLRGMVEERKQALASLKRRRSDLSQELRDIAQYIRDNLVRIERLCEKSIVILVDLLVSQHAEQRLIGDIKEQVKASIKDSLQLGPVSRQLLEDAKKEVDVLSREITAIVREDIYAMTGLYDAVHEHVQRTAEAIDGLLVKTGGGRDDRGDQDVAVFGQIEQALVTLIRDYYFELKAGVVRSESAHEAVLRKKRHDLLDSIFAQFERERRTRADRRSGKDRRKYQNATLSMQEQRTGKDRRSGKSRRR
jgi:hypothetical protein